MFSINEHSNIFNNHIFKQETNSPNTQDKSHAAAAASPNYNSGNGGMSYLSQQNTNSSQQHRKNSIFDHSQLANPQMTSPTANSSDLFSTQGGLSSAPMTAGSGGSQDPFELNSSIWSQGTSQQQQQQQQQNQPHYGSNSISATSGIPLNNQIGTARRASYNDYYPQSNTRFGSNYTIWSNNNGSNMIDDYTNNLLWQQQVQAAQAPQQATPVQPQQQQPQATQADTGFLLSPRRHSYAASSIDSPGFNSSASYDFNIPEEIGQLSPSSLQASTAITETNQIFQTAYQSVDFYFTNDQYGRVTIKDYSVSELSSMMENLVAKGAQLPRFSGSSLPSTQLVLIAFKCGRVDCFYLPDSSPLKLKINDLVVVEADRGRDLGKIVKLDVSIDEARLLKYLQHQEQQAALASFDNPGGSISSQASGSPPPSSSSQSQGNGGGAQQTGNVPTLHFPKPIVRFAMPNEVYQIVNKQSDEEKAKRICLLKIESSNLSMSVIDAEYQWDRRKLTFYYNAQHRIDFRDLVRELFRIYKTRIWMCAVNNDVIANTNNINGNGNQKELATNAEEKFHWLDDKKDPTMFIPRQFSSPDQTAWK